MDSDLEVGLFFAVISLLIIFTVLHFNKRVPEAKRVELGLPLAIFAAAEAVVILVKPIVLNIMLPSGRADLFNLGAANNAANASGACDIVAALLVVAGVVVLVRRIMKKKAAQT